MNGVRIAFVLSGFPRRSETFALNELLALDARGLVAAIFATKPGDGGDLQPACRPLVSRAHYLPPGDPGHQACALVDRLEGVPVTGIHGYFAHRPARVAAIAGERLGVPFGFSTHARDARKISRAELVERARRARVVIACNRDVAGDIGADADHLRVLPHGVDVERFQPTMAPPSGTPLRVLAVGRLVEKKGFDVLIRAVARARERTVVRIVGDGPERERLRRRIEATGCADRVELAASVTHRELPDEYRAAHVVVVPSVVARDGDRDGLPNVVLEAMASGRALIASDVGAIATAVRHDASGLLVPPGDERALAQAIARLGASAPLRKRFGENARQRVLEHFNLDRCAARFCEALSGAYS